jgi:hypothetical protein
MGVVIRRLLGHGDSVVNVEARPVVVIWPESDAIEGSTESLGGRAAVSGRADGSLDGPNAQTPDSTAELLSI